MASYVLTALPTFQMVVKGKYTPFINLVSRKTPLIVQNQDILSMAYQ